MCEFCKRVECAAGCPERDTVTEESAQIALAYCECCGRALYDGDECCLCADYVFCLDCIEENTVRLSSTGNGFIERKR